MTLYNNMDHDLYPHCEPSSSHFPWYSKSGAIYCCREDHRSRFKLSV